MGGYLACLMLYNHMDKGASSDLERARCQSQALVNTYGYDGFEPLTHRGPNVDLTSLFKKRINEKKSEKILSKCEKNVRKIIKDNKNAIVTLAKILVDKKVITSEDLKRTIS